MKKIISFFKLFIFSLFILLYLNLATPTYAVCTGLVDNPSKCPSGCTATFIPGPIGKYSCTSTKTTDNNGTICNPVLSATVGCGDQGETILARLLAAIINLFFIAGSVAVLVYLLMGGLAYITSEGDKNKAEIAKNRITNAVFGLVIIVAVYAVLRLLGQFLQINFFEDLIIKWPTIVE